MSRKDLKTFEWLNFRRYPCRVLVSLDFCVERQDMIADKSHVVFLVLYI